MTFEGPAERRGVLSFQVFLAEGLCVERLASVATRLESRRRSRRFSWVSISLEDRDLVFQDFSLVLTRYCRATGRLLDNAPR